MYALEFYTRLSAIMRALFAQAYRRNKTCERHCRDTLATRVIYSPRFYTDRFYVAREERATREEETLRAARAVTKRRERN